MEHEAWIENFKMFFPKEELWIYKCRQEDKTFVNVGASPDPESNFRLYYDYVKNQYTIVQEGRFLGSEYLTTDNLQLACACFIFVLSRYLPKYDITDGETFEEWKGRELIMANELFDNINDVYGGLKEEDKELVFRFWYIGKEFDYADFDCLRHVVMSYETIQERTSY